MNNITCGEAGREGEATVGTVNVTWSQALCCAWLHIRAKAELWLCWVEKTELSCVLGGKLKKKKENGQIVKQLF